jgi:hypothetical protein
MSRAVTLVCGHCWPLDCHPLLELHHKHKQLAGSHWNAKRSTYSDAHVAADALQLTSVTLRVIPYHWSVVSCVGQLDNPA